MSTINADSTPNPPEPEMELKSEVGVDYRRLQKLLSEGKWREADEETTRVMLKAAKREDEGWFDGEDIEQFPRADLRTIDQLWVTYSDGRFGFSVQKQIYVECGAKFDSQYPSNTFLGEKFYEKIGWRDRWRNQEKWKSKSFWSTTAPRGHLPREVYLFVSVGWHCIGLGSDREDCWTLLSRKDL